MIALALAALALGSPPPLVCPAGTVHRGAPPLEAFEEWCETAPSGGRGRREGPARTYYDDGGLWLDASYRDGLLDGPFVERYRGGKKAREGSYRAGQRSGGWRFFYEDGTLLEESSWTRDVPDGPFADYWPNGRPRNLGRRCLGAQCGRWQTFDDAGRLIGSVEYGDQRTAP